MGSASTAVRSTDGRPGVLDGSPARGFFLASERGGIRPTFGRTGQTVPSAPRALESSFSQNEPQGSQEEVVLHQLWFRLSREDRARFGGCFSQMVLRALERQARQEGGCEP